jgi:hypothetical protein
MLFIHELTRLLPFLDVLLTRIFVVKFVAYSEDRDVWMSV